MLRGEVWWVDLDASLATVGKQRLEYKLARISHKQTLVRNAG
jgi:hypothetical protein